MLKNSINDALWGLIAIMASLIIAIPAISIKNNILLLLAVILFNISFLLFALSIIGLAKHEKIVAQYFLKKYSRKRRLEVISNSILLCRIDDYSEWWKLQKEHNLASDHVSFGIFTAILGGVVEKEDNIKYGTHLEQCPVCQHYFKSWSSLISQKIKKRTKIQKQSDPF